MNDFRLCQGKPTTLGNSSGNWFLLCLLFFFVEASGAVAEDMLPGDTINESVELLSAEELGDLVAPIALYPDDLLAIVLPAASYPIQIVQAARYLEARESDSALEPDEGWDDVIIALLNYPEIIALLNDDLNWTWQLGQAVLIQEAAVIAAVKNFRESARIAGNLRSDDHQTVVVDDEGAIEIRPADPEVIYVPYYEPEQVTVYQQEKVYHYYPEAYPLYYYPFPADHVFSTGHFWGVTSVFSVGWSTHSLHLHHYGFDSHPYYNHLYYDPFYNRHPHLWLSFNYSSHYNHYRGRRRHHRHHEGNRWQPDRVRAGSRPANHNDDHRDWRDTRQVDLESGNRRRQHVVAERRSTRTTGRQRYRLSTTTNDVARVSVANTQLESAAFTERSVTRAERIEFRQATAEKIKVIHRETQGARRQQTNTLKVSARRAKNGQSRPGWVIAGEGKNEQTRPSRVTTRHAKSEQTRPGWTTRQQKARPVKSEQVRTQLTKPARTAQVTTQRTKPARTVQVRTRQTTPRQVTTRQVSAQTRVVRQSAPVIRSIAPVRQKPRESSSSSRGTKNSHRSVRGRGKREN